MKQREKQYKLDRDLITKFVSKGKILDVGCNGGFFLSYFEKNFVISEPSVGKCTRLC